MVYDCNDNTNLEINNYFDINFHIIIMTLI